MKGCYWYVGISLLVFSCTEKQKETDPVVFESEFYDVLNTVLDSSASKVALVFDKTEPIHKLPADFKAYDSRPRPFKGMHYDPEYFVARIADEVVNPSESKMMYESIDSTRVFTIDSAKIRWPVLNKKQLEDVYKNNNIDRSFLGEHEITKVFGGGCFITIYTPVFNSDYSVAFISLDYYCGPMVASGSEFILKKENNRWKVIKTLERWGT